MSLFTDVCLSFPPPPPLVLLHRYGAVIFACEVVGVTAVLPYCLMLLRRCTYVGSGGLPPDDGRYKLPKDKRFIVRVLVPCYKVRFLGL
jgi:hypothetical protein